MPRFEPASAATAAIMHNRASVAISVFIGQLPEQGGWLLATDGHAAADLYQAHAVAVSEMPWAPHAPFRPLRAPYSAFGRFLPPSCCQSPERVPGLLGGPARGPSHHLPSFAASRSVSAPDLGFLSACELAHSPCRATGHTAPHQRGAKPMTSQLLQPDEIMDQPELAVGSNRLGQALMGWCVLASVLVMFAVF